MRTTAFFKLMFVGMLAMAVVAGCSSGGGGGTAAYKIGGTVTGLSGILVLQDNGADDLSITTSGTFTFAKALTNGSSYAVTVKTQPAGQTCSVTNGSGKVSGANVTSVVVSCGYTVGGTVSGLNGTLVLQDNSTDDLSITTSGTFTFAKALANGSSYAVTIKTQPTAQSCYGTNLTGTIAGANVTNVTLSCYNSGTLDHTFNSTGYVANNNAAGGSSAGGQSIITDAQGRILVTGLADDASSNQYMAIWRYNANGTLDTSFGTNGIVFNNNAAGGSNAAGYSIITDAQGKILVTGYARDASNNDYMAIWRYIP